MSSENILLIIAAYFGLLILISYLTGRKADNQSFFIGNKQSPWYIVAFGMIGASLSGVTFISVPGWVESSHFNYMQVVLGYLIGYFIIAFVLMPVYYKMNLTSIYSYLGDRFGRNSYKTGAFYFLLSRVIGAAFRLFLVANVLHEYVLTDLLDFEFSYELTVILSVLLIWLYTFRGGIKTIIWTDTLQTLFMLLAVGISIALVINKMDIDNIFTYISSSEMSQIFFFDDIKAGNHFIKQFLGGAFVAITMTGMDQDMMQKNLSCRNIKEAQKNMISFSVVLVFVNLIFLSLGLLLYSYADVAGLDVPERSDMLYPFIALEGGLGPYVALFFILGLIAAAYSSADSALTSLTTSVSVDFLEVDKYNDEKKKEKTRKWAHVSVSVLLIIVIILFKYVINESVIDQLLAFAGYTYGPLLGLFAFGILTKFKIEDKLVLDVCLFSPILTFIIKTLSINNFFWGYQFGYELILINGLLTFGGLYLLRVEKN